jgi:hypothetical protein
VRKTRDHSPDTSQTLPCVCNVFTCIKQYYSSE